MSVHSGQPPAHWTALGACLSRDLRILAPARRAAYLEEWSDISSAEESLDDRLVVGILGGTGVGKSTLINALAGKEISATGERRPTTDRVIAYRHERTPLPEDMPRGDLAEPEMVHSTASLERVLVLDFPDFDSVEQVHHEVLARYLPHIDVLLVLVDDMKYADLRLFELLRGISQSSGNLHVLLNKVDRLEMRYPGRSREVAREILDDLDDKLGTHADIHLEPDRLLVISARNAFLERAGPSGEDLEDVGAVGDFPRVVQLLEGYREEKRRRAAKELNLEARKAALLESLRQRALDPRLLERAERAQSVLTQRKALLEGILEGVPTGIFTVGERRLLVAASLRRGAASFGFPVDFFVTLLRELRPVRFSGKEAPGEFSTGRIRRHYRAYLEGLRNAERALEMEIGDFVPAAAGDSGSPRTDSSRGAGAADPSSLLSRAENDLQRGIGAAESALAARSRLWNHALPALVVVLFLWSMLYPAVRTVLERVRGDEDVFWSDVPGELLSGLISALSPATLVVFFLAVVLAYVITSVAAWVRQVQRIEQAVTLEEISVRKGIRKHGEAVLGSLTERVSGWMAERRELEELLGEKPGAA